LRDSPLFSSGSYVPIFKLKLHTQGQVPIPANAGLLQATGPMVNVQIEVPQALSGQLASASQPVPSPVTGLALIDTGATMTAVDSSVVTSLGINPVGVVPVGTAGGPTKQPVYPIRLQIQGVGLVMNFSRVTGAPLQGMGLVALLGRDVLARMILIYDGPSSEYTIGF
jgi:predicted aspartyl protease